MIAREAREKKMEKPEWSLKWSLPKWSLLAQKEKNRNDRQNDRSKMIAGRQNSEDASNPFWVVFGVSELSVVIISVFAANIRLPCDQHCSFACSKPQYTNLFEFELEGASNPSSNSNKFMYCGLEHANEQCWSHGSPMLAANTLLITIITTESAQKLQTQPKTRGY